MLYFHTTDYNIKAEGIISALDQRLKIQWPNDITEQSERDTNNPMLNDDFLGVKI